MGEEKRFAAFLILTMLVVMLTPPLFRWLGLTPPRPPAHKAEPEAAGEPVAPEEAKTELDGAQTKPDDTAPAPDKKLAQAMPSLEEPELQSVTLGSLAPQSGFLMQLRLINRGAAVQEIALTEFLAEDRQEQLRLVSVRDGEHASFELGIKGMGFQLENRNWQVVPSQEVTEEVQVARFRTVVPEKGLAITKTFSLKKQSYAIGLEIELENLADRATEVVYRMGGPRGFVLEGAWYATKKRDVAIADGMGKDLTRHSFSATQLAKGSDRIRELAENGQEIRRSNVSLPQEWFDRFDADHNAVLTGPEIDAAADYLAGEGIRLVERPVRFVGVDGQFFAVLAVIPPPTSPEERWDAVTLPILVHKEKPVDRSDVGVEVETRSIALAAGETVRQSLRIYAGPRSKKVLEYTLGEPALVQAVMNYSRALFIFPVGLVTLTASTMLYLLSFFHGWVGNWGVAIIMLTVLVRMLMFPLSRKQAMSAVKMQALKPELDAMREKYKNDKEKLSRAQMELWRKHGVNPLGGCLPLLIQMPIFIGLWQGLSSSVDLRQAKFFLWIDDLAAPDALFHWGDNIPLISWFFGPYFNLLPTILIGLFMIQQKLFMPPKSDPPDPQVEMQQKMMTYMLVFFGYIFWRLPSGLCVYYIASTLWGIAERKLLPKFQPLTPSAATAQTAGAGERQVRTAPDRDARAGRDGRDRRPSRKEPTLADRLNEMIKKLVAKANKK